MSDTVDSDARLRAQGAEAKAELALHKIDSHEEICAERYQGIRDSTAEVKAMISEMGKQYAGGINRVHDRIDAGQKRLIVWLGSVVGALAIGLGSVVFFLITK
jgi:hypothetical protein